jgi:hypothetical protein
VIGLRRARSVSGRAALVPAPTRTHTGTERPAALDEMLKQMEIRSRASLSALAHTADGVAAAFPELVAVLERVDEVGPARVGRPAPDLVVVPTSYWRAADFDPLPVDDAVAEAVAAAGHFSLCLMDDAPVDGELLETALQVLTRCQRHLDGRNAASSTPLFDAILAGHRALHDLRRPLGAADHAHALDTWRWVLRLEASASVAVQVAALFHARAHAQLVAVALREVGASRALAARVAELVATRERRDDDPEKALLDEAVALSFLSLDAPRFAHHHGPAHTARKVSHALARLGPRGRRALVGVRHRADIAALIAEGA